MDVLIKKETAICQANDDRVGHMIGGSWTLKTDKHTTMNPKTFPLASLLPVLCVLPVLLLSVHRSLCRMSISLLLCIILVLNIKELIKLCVMIFWSKLHYYTVHNSS